MSGSPCLYTGDFLSWADFTWLKEGATPEEINVRGEEEVCGQVGSYNLLLPSLYNWEEANKICSILGNGRVPEIRNTKEFQNYVEISKPCQAIWTPYSDEGEEGIFVRKSFNPPLSDSQNGRCDFAVTLLSQSLWIWEMPLSLSGSRESRKIPTRSCRRITWPSLSVYTARLMPSLPWRAGRPRLDTAASGVLIHTGQQASIFINWKIFICESNS